MTRPAVSPELVLVSPELAARERAALPERPWETFTPPACVARPIVPLPAAAPVAPRRAERALAFFPVVVLVAFVALLLVGSLPGMTQRPTLGPRTPSQPVPSGTSTP